MSKVILIARMDLHLVVVYLKLNLKKNKNVPKCYMSIVAIRGLITSKHEI